MYRVIKSSATLIDQNFHVDIKIYFGSKFDDVYSSKGLRNLKKLKRTIEKELPQNHNSSTLRTLPTFKKNHIWDQNKIELFNSIIQNIRNIFIEDRHTVKEDKQSNKSYSWYFKIIPKFNSDVEAKHVPVTFRISDYELKDKTARIHKTDPIIVYITINDKRYTPEEAIDAVKKICSELKQGDYTNVRGHAPI